METLQNLGNILNSRYRILHQLERKRNGHTYIAEDINAFNKYCVLKEIAPRLQGTFELKKARVLFEREILLLFQLQHRQIPKFRELFCDRQNPKCLMLVRDYVEGQTYDELLQNRLSAGKRFSEAEIHDLFKQMLPVLEYIHSMGIIHRQISPDNIVLRRVDRLPVLIDFGSIVEIENKAYRLFAPSFSNEMYEETLLDKHGYAPPEQIARGIVFAHSDLYALAAVAVVLLTGKKPQLIDSNCCWNWQEEVNISPKLEWILCTMLSLHPKDRFCSAREVIKALPEISAIAWVTENINSKRSPNLQFTPIKALLHLSPKLLFSIPLALILLLSGWFCWQYADLEPSEESFDKVFFSSFSRSLNKF